MKKSVLLSVILIFLLTACALSACMPLGGEIVSDPDAILSGVKQISLDRYQTEYWLGQELNLEGSVLKVLLETGEIVSVDAKNAKLVSVEGYDRFKEGVQIVSVKYGGKTSATFTVNVKTPEIRQIALKSYPKKLNYIEGEKLDMSGAEITVMMENGANVDFTADNSIVSGSAINDEKEFVVVGNSLQLSIRYGAMETPFQVNVAPKTLIGIAVGKLPAKQSYYINQSASEFDPTGLTLLYTYNNGRTETADAGADSHLFYDVDFGVATNKSPVKVRYCNEAGETLFETGFTVVVDEARYDSIRVVRRPDGVDRLIEGFSRIDYSTGVVAVSFTDGSEREFKMDDPEINKDNYDNTVIGIQQIGVYYRNNELKHATLTVTTEAKKATSVALFGKDEIENGVYFEGQTAQISIAKLYYVVRYNNGASGEKLPVSESMLTNGSNLIATANGGAGGEKTIEFLIEGVPTAIRVPITPAAVSEVEITEKPVNLFAAQTGAPRPAGGAIKVTYNNRKSESVSMENPGVSLVSDLSSAAVGSSAAVSVYYQNDGDLTKPHATYSVTVIEKAVASVSLIRSASKIDGYRYGDTLALRGAQFDVTFEGESAATRYEVSEDLVLNGVSSVKFSSGEIMPVSLLFNGGGNRLSKTGDVFLWFYGVRADRSFRVTVAGRVVRGISIASTAGVDRVRFTGEDYDSVAGLQVNVSYTDNSTDFYVFGGDAAARVSGSSAISDAGFYFYTEGSVTEPGTVTVTVVFANRNSLGALTVYSDSYAVIYRDAELLRLTGIFTLSGGVYEEAASLGAQPKGLTPYLEAYYLGLYYENDATEYVPVTVPMTDYDRKNLTVGTRAVTVRFGGLRLSTTIEVTDATVTAVSIGTLPRLNYVFTESLSLAGGTLIRTFVAGGLTKQDTVDMKEADVSFLTPWPTSVDDFKGAESMTIAIELRYESVRAVNFSVAVYRPLDLTDGVTIANTQNYYGNVSDAAVSIGAPLPGFELPTFTVRYRKGNEDVSTGLIPTVDRYGNVSYPAPKLVGDYTVVVESEGNRYYTAFERSAEFKVSPLPITLTPNFVSKTYGTADPEFTYVTSNELLWKEALYGADGMPLGTGSFVRSAGENVGTYAITENPDDRFAHPYFIVTVESAGTLQINPALVELDADPEIIFFKKDADGSPVDQKSLLGFRFRFVSVSADGTKTVVTQSEIEAHEDDSAYEIYRKYIRELSKSERGYYSYTTYVKGEDGLFGTENPIAKKGKYELKVTISVPSVGNYAQNFLFFDEASPGVGSFETRLTVSVVAEPFAPPAIGSNTLRLATDVTDLEKIEEMVAQAERDNAASYDLVATDKFVYLWKYRPSQRGIYPEGEFLAYNTGLLGGEFLAYDAASGRGGFAVGKDHLQNTDGNAFIRLKFVANGADGDRGASEEISFLMPNVF